MDPTEGFVRGGTIGHRGLNLTFPTVREGRTIHSYGSGPFAKLVMPPLPELPGVYLWVINDVVMYVGQTVGTLRNRLGPRGYATISGYNTLAREPGRVNGGQQTNCRINALANAVLTARREIVLWYRVTDATEAKALEAQWMGRFGMPPWNRRTERVSS